MTTPPGTVSPRGLTLGGITALLAMVATYSGAIDYVRDWAALWLHWPQLRAICVGILIGAAFTSWVPYVLGPAFCAARAKTIMRAGSSVLAFGVAWRLQPTELGFYYALLAGMAGMQVFMGAAYLIFRAFPALEPVALRDSAE